MSTQQELEARIEELEAEIQQRDDKITELRDELRQAVEMADEMRQHVEDGNALIDSWIEVFQLEQDEAGVYRFDSRQSDMWDLHSALLDKHNKLVREWNKFVPRYNATVAPRPPGRPLAASDAQVVDVLKRHKAGASLRAIAAATGVGLRTVRSILAGSKRTAELRKQEFDRLRAAEYRARKKGRDALPARITGQIKQGEELVKAAKGLGKSSL